MQTHIPDFRTGVLATYFRDRSTRRGAWYAFPRPALRTVVCVKFDRTLSARSPVNELHADVNPVISTRNIQNAGIQLRARSVHIDHPRYGIGSSELEIPHQREPTGNDDFAIVRIDFDAATTLDQGAYVQPVHSAFRCTSMHLKINQVRMSLVQAHADQSSKETSADCHRTQFHS
tara:strand:+ start:33390 stop:33914 length:525 start_codon:yes stop_codon:yes gene_type:complete